MVKSMSKFSLDPSFVSSTMSMELPCWPSSLKLRVRISRDFCFHSDTSFLDEGTWNVMCLCGVSSMPFALALALGSVLLKVSMVSLPMGFLGARSSTSALARFRLPIEAFSCRTLRFIPVTSTGTASSSLLSEARVFW